MWMMAKLLYLFIVCGTLLLQGVGGTVLTIKNNCPYTIWPGTLHSAASPLPITGFELETSQSVSMDVPTGWAGRIWARTGCSMDPTGRFSCQSADCGSGKLQCDGAVGAPPASLAVFALDGINGKDLFSISLVDGFNVPIYVGPTGDDSRPTRCGSVRCTANINSQCPQELWYQADNGDVVGCKSACLAFGYDHYCCTGKFASPDKCRHNQYSLMFKAACSQAITYAYDQVVSVCSRCSRQRALKQLRMLMIK